MSAIASAKLLAWGAALRSTGSRSAARHLVSAVVNGSQEERTLAGMLLVQQRTRAVGVVVETLRAGVHSPELVTVLASIGGPQAEETLAQLADVDTYPISEIARQALRDLAEIRRHGRS